MPSSHRLFASYEKIKRAESKFDYIQSRTSLYAQRGPYSLHIARREDWTHIIACLERDPPDDLAWEVVEAVGHLRGALDKLMVELVDQNGRGSSGVGFPFGGLSAGKAETFPSKRMEDGIKKKLTPDQWALVAAQKPYPGGNDTLWAVNEIANADKHRKGLVCVVPSLGGGVNLAIGGAGRSARISRALIGDAADQSFLRNKERERTVLSVQDGSFNFDVQDAVSISVVFGELPPVTGQHVIVTLNQQIRLTQRIVDTFHKAFF